MSWPPMLMHVKVKNEENDFGIWLPLFLLAPVLFAILIVLSPLIFIALLVTWPSGWGPWALNALWAALCSLWNLKGLEVDVQNYKEHVKVSVI